MARPGLYETLKRSTPAENRLQVCLRLAMDEHLVPMKTRSGSMLAMPV
jgi:hypothetical protein